MHLSVFLRIKYPQVNKRTKQLGVAHRKHFGLNFAIDNIVYFASIKNYHIQPHVFLLSREISSVLLISSMLLFNILVQLLFHPLE